jgi:uncharacterized protein YuzE
MEAVEVKSVLNRVPELLHAPYSRIWTVYDKEADVLYLNFKNPSHADDSELTGDDLIIRYEKGSVVGITVLNASRRGFWIWARRMTRRVVFHKLHHKLN